MSAPESSCSAHVLEVLVHKAHQHLGADFSGARGVDLLRRLRLLAQEQAIGDFGPWLEHLAFAEWTEAQVEALTPAFTVGETYFCRDAEAFAWLSAEHLAPLIARRRLAGQRYLRLWSAACCTGEEAYSLLFLLDSLLGADSQAWTLEIVATDINAESLARAAQGHYGQNAFRRNEEAFRTRHFQAVGRAWHVRPQWRGRIRFIRHNLANAALPDRTKGLAELDLILCRNVLMYFSAERATDTLYRLLGCLATEGLLLLSAVEAGLATQAGLTGFWAGSNYALRADARLAPLPRVLATLPVASPRPWSSAPLPTPAGTQARLTMAMAASVPRPAERHWHLAEQALEQGRQEEAAQHLHEYLACPGLSLAQQHRASLSLARCFADRQQNVQARDWLQRALSLDAGSATAYWLQGVLLQQEGDGPGALRAVHKALYLEPDLVLAHFLQAQLLRERGQLPACRKALSICCQLLEAQPGDMPVHLGEGISGAQLRALCKELMESLPACQNP